MRKYIYNLTVVAAVAVSLSSCTKDEYLNPVSDTSLSDVNAFDTKDRILNQINGIYSGLKSGQLQGGRYFIYNDARAENFLSNDGNRVTARAAWEFSETSGDNEVNNLWAAAYTVINRVNIFLAGMEAKGNGVMGTTDAPKLNAEARFVRAVAYFDLLQFYSRPFWDGNGSKPGLPLRLTPITNFGSNNLARSTVAQVYQQILDDLNFAETNLALTNGSAVLNTTHAHRNTAIAMKVRVYLSMRNYASVITEANKIVSAGAPFTASTGVAHALQDSIKTVFTTYTTTESILSSPFTTTDAPGTQNQLGGYYLPTITTPVANGAAGIFYLNPAGVLGDAGWTAADARRRNMVMANGGKQWLNKFSSPGPFLDWAPVLRYSDVLLSLAEAIARTTNTVDTRAVALLNAVRHRSDLTITYTVASFADAAALIAGILQERNIEFLGEGIRSVDILRLGLDFPAKAIPGFSVAAVPPASPAYTWPTPSEESRYNSLID